MLPLPPQPSLTPQPAPANRRARPSRAASLPPPCKPPHRHRKPPSSSRTIRRRPPRAPLGPILYRARSQAASRHRRQAHPRFKLRRHPRRVRRRALRLRIARATIRKIATINSRRPMPPWSNVPRRMARRNAKIPMSICWPPSLQGRSRMMRMRPPIASVRKPRPRRRIRSAWPLRSSNAISRISSRRRCAAGACVPITGARIRHAPAQTRTRTRKRDDRSLAHLRDPCADGGPCLRQSARAHEEPNVPARYQPLGDQRGRRA